MPEGKLKSIWLPGEKLKSVLECGHDMEIAVQPPLLPVEEGAVCAESRHSSGFMRIQTSPIGGFRREIWNISGDVGLVSAGRIDKDTPPLTTPGHTSKSSAMDISSHIFGIEIREGARGRFRPRADPHPM